MGCNREPFPFRDPWAILQMDSILKTLQTTRGGDGSGLCEPRLACVHCHRETTQDLAHGDLPLSLHIAVSRNSH